MHMWSVLCAQGHPFHTGGINCVGLHKDGNGAAITGDEDGIVCISNIATGRVGGRLVGAYQRRGEGTVRGRVSRASGVGLEMHALHTHDSSDGGDDQPFVPSNSDGTWSALTTVFSLV